MKARHPFRGDGQTKTWPTKATKQKQNMENTTVKTQNQSAALDKLAPALSAAQASLGAARKDSLNPHFRNQYASLESVWDAAREVLAPNGLSVIQTFEPGDGTCLSLRTMLLHNSGQWIDGTISLRPIKNDPQQMGSAATYARRYSLSAILGIVADDDDDGHKASIPPDAEPIKRQTPLPPVPEVPPKEKPQTGELADWRKILIPAFVSKKRPQYAGKTLNEMAPDDLIWWAKNYEPRPFRGEINPMDTMFKEALMNGLDALEGGSLPLESDTDVPY